MAVTAIEGNISTTSRSVIVVWKNRTNINQVYTRTVAPVKFFIKIYIRNSSGSRKGGGGGGVVAKRSRKDKLADAICENFILLLERKNTGPRLNLILTQLQVLESETFYVGYNISLTIKN